MIRILFLTGVLLLLAGAPGSGQPEEKKKKPLPPQLAEMVKLSPAEFIKRFDKDGDGKLSADELPPFLARAIERNDVDGDNKLDRAEVEQMLQNLRFFFGITTPQAGNVDRFVDKILQEQDANKDGKIARAEAQGRLAAAFDRADANKDGYLDRDELRALAQRVMAEQKGGPPGPPPGLRQPGPDFDALDKNADGRLSRDELRDTPFAARFDEIDADRSGQIDRREFESFLKRGAK